MSPLWLRLQAEVEGPLALLRVATSVNAELLGRDDLGRIRSGAVADLLVLDGDPNVPTSLAGGSGFTPGSDERAAVARHREGMTTATKIPAAWAAAHAPAAGVPRWARVAAYAVPLTVLPSSAWRIAACTFHAPIVRGDVVSDVTSSGVPGVPLWLYVILLSIVSELLAFTAVGLVSTWGEVFPRWIPVLRGRRVPALAAVVPAALGAAVLTLLWTWMAVSMSLGLRIDGRPQAATAPVSFGDWKGLVAVAAYAPLLLWGPLLGAVTISYWRRRRRS